MRVVITGPGGYIAKNLAALLESEGHLPLLLGVRNESWKSFDFSSCDAIVHAAALVHEKGGGATFDEFERVNVHLTAEIARKARSAGVEHFIFMSSLSVYGAVAENSRPGAPCEITEKTPLVPNTHYGKSKLMAEQALAGLSTGSFKTLCVRAPMVYGRNCPGNYRTLRKIALALRVYPKHENQRSMIHVDSLCRYLLICLENRISGIGHPQDETPVCTADMIAAIARQNGRKAFGSRLLGLILPLAAKALPPLNKAFGNLTVNAALSEVGHAYRVGGFSECMARTEPWQTSSHRAPNGERKALFVSHVGGFARFNRPAVRLLKENGYSVDYAANCPPNIDDCDRSFVIPFMRSPFSRKNIEAYRQLKRIIDAEHYDFIHCHTPVGGAVARLAARNARKKGAKVAYTAHGFHFYKGGPLISWLLYYPVERLLARLSDVVITINREDYAYAQRFKTKAFYMPGVGVNLTRFCPATPEEKAALRAARGFAESDFILVYAAEFSKNKNQRLIIEALAKLRETAPNVKAVFAGIGDELETCRALAASLGLSNAAHFPGYVTDIENLYRMADLGVSASFREGLPVNIIECMACGLPIVATRNRGHLDLVTDGENGLLLPNTSPADPAAFAAAVLRLKNDKALYIAMSKNNLERAKSFDEPASLAALSRIYSRLLPEGRQTP